MTLFGNHIFRNSYIRFQGSSFKAIGNQDKVRGQWAVVGGTGVFTFARGTISIRRIQHNGSSNVKEISIHSFCRTPEKSVTDTMAMVTFSQLKPFIFLTVPIQNFIVGNIFFANAYVCHSRR